MPPEVIPTIWQPSALVLVYGPATTHIMPGHLLGFRAHIKAIGQQYGDCYDHNSNTKLDFSIKSYWSPPRTAKHKTYRGKYETRETWMTSRFSLDVIDAVAGATLADAQANWDARTAEITELLNSYRTTRTCGHCEGRGFITTPKTKGASV
jgi:hypothetical protein